MSTPRCPVATWERGTARCRSWSGAPRRKLELHHKDLGIALRTARELGVYVPSTALVDQMLAELKAAGDGGLDHSALLKVIEQGSGHEI